jgi:hypothetical protein
MITNRDRDIVDWIARVGAVEPAHVMFRFKMGRTVTYRRLAALEAHGLVERVRLLHGQPGLIVATKAGLRLCGLQALGVTKVSAGAARHWQASSLVAVILERHRGLGAVGGVREIRAAERATGKPVASVSIGAVSHIPDLVIWGPKGAGQPGGTAVEVELTAKAPQRLRSILRGWRLAQMIGTVTNVLYICAPGVERAVIREIEALWFEQGIQVARMPTPDDLIRQAGT